MNLAVHRARARAHRARPADYVDELSAQSEFMAATTRRLIWYAYNGAGKTCALVLRLIRVFEGSDPICRGITNHELTILLCVTGYEAVSARDMARQLHALLPTGLVAQVDLDDEGRPIGRAHEWYARGRGFRGRPPRLVVQRGPMRGTVLNVVTLGSGSGAAAGGTVDLVLVNEPIDGELFESSPPAIVLVLSATSGTCSRRFPTSRRRLGSRRWSKSSATSGSFRLA